MPFVNTIFHCFGSFFHSFVPCEYTELYIYLSFVYFSICWVLFHAMPPFAFVFCWAYGLAEGRLILSQPSADCSLCGDPLGRRLPQAGGGVRSPALAGRGGSVSRRDLIPKTKERALLSWAHKFGARIKPIPSRSSGGGPGEALLAEKRPPPENSIFPFYIVPFMMQLRQ